MRKYIDGKAEVVEYKGIKFRRYPESDNWSDRMYYRPGSKYIRQGVEALHREIYKDTYGEIPEGCHVHHLDSDPLNNDPDNLGIIHEASHQELHGDDTKTDEYLRKRQKHLDRIRAKAAAWHSSKEGREWHSEHAKEVWENREPDRATCEFCGTEFETPFPSRAKYCSNNCKSRHRYRAGKDNEERACEYCGETYEVNKYAKNRFCSRSCAAKARRRTGDGTFG